VVPHRLARPGRADLPPARGGALAGRRRRPAPRHGASGGADDGRGSGRLQGVARHDAPPGGLCPRRQRAGVGAVRRVGGQRHRAPRAAGGRHPSASGSRRTTNG
jgi:hypothetical protein